MSGGTPFASFRDLAHAWGREKGFHIVLASNIFDRRGETERKRRSDAGRLLTEDEKLNFRRKIKKAKLATAAATAAATASMEAAVELTPDEHHQQVVAATAAAAQQQQPIAVLGSQPQHMLNATTAPLSHPLTSNILVDPSALQKQEESTELEPVVYPDNPTNPTNV